MIIRRRRKYATVYLDPPWPERGGGKIKRGADKHYPLMTVRQIFEFDIDRWAERYRHQPDDEDAHNAGCAWHAAKLAFTPPPTGADR